MKIASFKKELGLLWPFYVMRLLFGIAAATLAPVMILYFWDLGLNFSYIGFLVAIQLAAPTIFEIPTGAIADIFGRKTSVTLSYILTGFTMAMIPFFSEFIWLALLFFALSAFGTFASGADEAWMVDWLKYNRQQHFIQTAYTRLATLLSAGFVIGGLVSGIAVLLLGIKGVWFVAAALDIITATILAIFGREHFKRRRVSLHKAIGRTFKLAAKGAVYIRRHRVLLWLVLGSMLGALGALWQLVWQPYAFQLGLNPAALGPIVSVGAFIGIFMPMASSAFLKMIKSEKRVLIFDVAITIFVLIMMLFVNAAWQAALLFIVLLSLAPLTGPIIATFRQEFIPSQQRATITSIDRAVTTGAGFVAFILGGMLTDAIGMAALFVISAIIYAAVLMCYLQIKS